MKIDFKKGNGLVPAIVQDAETGKVLMLGYMNQEAYRKTVKSGRVTFFSRSQQQLWTKGETSGNYLLLKEILVDCDGDTLLVKATPTGPVCHTGKDTCFAEVNPGTENFLRRLEEIIRKRQQEDHPHSYTRHLLKKGTTTIARKVNEEATEVLIAALEEGKTRLVEESADLLYHLLVLLADQGIAFREIEKELARRHQARS